MKDMTNKITYFALALATKRKQKKKHQSTFLNAYFSKYPSPIPFKKKKSLLLLNISGHFLPEMHQNPKSKFPIKAFQNNFQGDFPIKIALAVKIRKTIPRFSHRHQGASKELQTKQLHQTQELTIIKRIFFLI